jgi:hypothetical protein
MNDSIIQTLTVPFAAGFVVQRFLEILDSLAGQFLGNANTKKVVLGLASLALGWLIASQIPIELFHALMKQAGDKGISAGMDHLLAGIFISAGTEGFNSLLKFAQYKKETTHADAERKSAAGSGTQSAGSDHP